MRKRNPFNLSHFNLTTIPFGTLVPLTWMECMPGDLFRHMAISLIRCEQMLAPLMHPVKCRIHHWFVPFRLIWEDFEKFITGGPDGNDATEFPHFALNSVVSAGSLINHLGIPPGDYTGSGIEVSANPVRAYNLIWNQFYRDQQIMTELANAYTSGVDTTTNLTMARVAWEKDYFTTCRPEPILGDAVTIPIAADAPIFGDNMDFDDNHDVDNIAQIRDAQGPSANLRSLKNQSMENVYGGDGSWGTGELKADLSTSTGIDIGDMALSLAENRLKARVNKTGSSYYDLLKSLGLKPQDVRLQLPEYLGGGATPLEFSEVMATDGANTGQTYGHGMAAMRTNRYKMHAHEHGIIMSLMSVVPKAIYANGIHRSWSRTAKEMYFTPEYEYTGSMTVRNKELYSLHSDPEGIFGHQFFYDDYRYHPSTISGDFQEDTDDHYHMARMYGSDPALNESWLACNPSTEPFASLTKDPLKVYVRNVVHARRPMKRNPEMRVF